MFLIMLRTLFSCCSTSLGTLLIFTLTLFTFTTFLDGGRDTLLLLAPNRGPPLKLFLLLLGLLLGLLLLDLLLLDLLLGLLLLDLLLLDLLLGYRGLFCMFGSNKGLFCIDFLFLLLLLLELELLL